MCARISGLQYKSGACCTWIFPACNVRRAQAKLSGCLRRLKRDLRPHWSVNRRAVDGKASLSMFARSTCKSWPVLWYEMISTDISYGWRVASVEILNWVSKLNLPFISDGDGNDVASSDEFGGTKELIKWTTDSETTTNTAFHAEFMLSSGSVRIGWVGAGVVFHCLPPKQEPPLLPCLPPLFVYKIKVRSFVSILLIKSSVLCKLLSARTHLMNPIPVVCHEVIFPEWECAQASSPPSSWPLVFSAQCSLCAPCLIESTSRRLFLIV